MWSRSAADGLHDQRQRFTGWSVWDMLLALVLWRSVVVNERNRPPRPWRNGASGTKGAALVGALGFSASEEAALATRQARLGLCVFRRTARVTTISSAAFLARHGARLRLKSQRPPG